MRASVPTDTGGTSRPASNSARPARRNAGSTIAAARKVLDLTTGELHEVKDLRPGRVAVFAQQDEEGGQGRGQQRCPACGARDAMRFLASRSASLTSVAVGHLFTTPLNTDRKLLAFSDSVQDASHRAGFSGNLRRSVAVQRAAGSALPASNSSTTPSAAPCRSGNAARPSRSPALSDAIASAIVVFPAPFSPMMTVTRGWSGTSTSSKHRTFRSRSRSNVSPVAPPCSRGAGAVAGRRASPCLCRIPWKPSCQPILSAQ
jgi:DEAD/DEAH box helicase domain-containing protein